MKELKQRLGQLEARSSIHESDDARASLYPSPSPEKRQSSSPDDETEAEANLPPAYATAGIRLSDPPSATSLLASARQHVQLIRPDPPPQASNPIFLPFPAPSPTSPFLTSGSTVSSVPDPSPFLAPLHNIGLFGGMFNLDGATALALPQPIAVPLENTAPLDVVAGLDKKTRKDMEPEEAANLLLAFSSPDTLRPQVVVNVAGRHRRLTLENDEFSLDRGVSVGVVDMIGKSAGDILCMTRE